MRRIRRSRPWSHLLVAVLALPAACGSYEDRRLRELIHEKGFGTRAQGDATKENYVAGGDRVYFTVEPAALQTLSAQQLVYLTQPQLVAIDGTIHIPYYGRLQALGKTESELSALVERVLQPSFPFAVDVEARILIDNKNIYAFGETALRGVVPMVGVGNADVTLLRAVATIGWTQLANIARVFLIRPDAEHPMVVEVNILEMITTGNTRYNLQLRENDIIYIPPTFLGLVARILERLLAPINLAVMTLFNVAQVRTSYEVATGQQQGFFFRF